MNQFKIILILFIFYSSLLDAKDAISIPIYNITDTCNAQPRLYFIDANNDNYWDIIFFERCGSKPIAFQLNVKSLADITTEETATLTQGSIEAKFFTILIYDPNSFRYTHKLYYNNQLSKAVLEDYTDNGSEPTSYEEADNYFYTQQMGNMLLITKKAQIDVQSVVLCSLDGKIISHLQNVEGWSQFMFDMSLEPSGMYLLRFIARERAMTKRVVYLR